MADDHRTSISAQVTVRPFDHRLPLERRTCDVEGPENVRPALLIHGWPDDASTWERVAPSSRETGLRTVVPTLRGFGETRFVDPATPYTGNSAVLAIDLIGLMDALGEAVVRADRDVGRARTKTD